MLLAPDRDQHRSRTHSFPFSCQVNDQMYFSKFGLQGRFTSTNAFLGCPSKHSTAPAIVRPRHFPFVLPGNRDSVRHHGWVKEETAKHEWSGYCGSPSLPSVPSEHARLTCVDHFHLECTINFKIFAVSCGTPSGYYLLKYQLLIFKTQLMSGT